MKATKPEKLTAAQVVTVTLVLALLVIAAAFVIDGLDLHGLSQFPPYGK